MLALCIVAAACGGDSGGATADAGAVDGDALVTGADASVMPPSAFCPPLGAPSGPTVIVDVGESIADAVRNAAPGTTIHIADGVYDVSNDPIWVDTPGITLRSLSGNRDGVILDGGRTDNGTGGVISVVADDVTIAELTIRNARFHAIHVTGSAGGDTLRTTIYNVVVQDPGEQGIKINASGGGFADGGEIACSRITLSRSGATFVNTHESSGSYCYTGGIDAHDARDWTVRDNYIAGFWCDGVGQQFLSEHAIHFWTGSRDTHITRNLLVDNVRGIGLGLGPGGRTYADDPCAGVGDAGHYGGLVHNNVIVDRDPALFASGNSVQEGISLWAACNARVLHNTVFFADAGNSAIEWRYDQTSAVIANNLTSHRLWDRGGTATTVTNVDTAGAADFVDVGNLNLHLSAGASAAIDQGTDQYRDACGADIDGDPRDNTPDIGADERL